MTLKVSQLGIVADDLTGACNVASCFAPFVGMVRVCVTTDNVLINQSNLMVINTQSRLMSPEKSRIVIQEIGKVLGEKQVIFKKIDSAMRGHVGSEIEGLIEAVGSCRVIVAPALPAIGRTTSLGVQYDNGIPIDKTEYAKDPASPIRSACIRELLGKTAAICRIADASVDGDLREIVEKGIDGTKVVFVGSLGLAAALTSQLETESWKKPQAPTARHPMIVCGSAYSRSRSQIEYAASQCDLIDWPQDMTENRIRSISMDRPVVVRLAGNSTCNASLGVAELLSRFTDAVMSLIRRFNPDGLGVIGGETAFDLLRKLNANNLNIYGHISEVIAYGLIADGMMGGRPFTAKGGSVGHDDAVIRMLDYLYKGKT